MRNGRRMRKGRETYTMVCQQRETFFQALFGVHVAADEPGHEQREEDAEDDPFYDDAFLEWC